MAEKKHGGLKAVKTDYEQLNKEIKQHRIKILKRVGEIALLVVLLLVIINLLYALRTYDSYDVRSSMQRENTSIAEFEQFLDYILEYSNDGIRCVANDGELIWNQAFEMTKPMVEIAGDYLAVYDQGGTTIYILKEDGLQKKIETAIPIQTVCLAEQGTVAVLMKEEGESQVKLFDKKGKELANGKFYDNKGSFPIDIALSSDAQKLAVCMIDVTGGKVGSTISFYNFGSVGQSEIDNNVGIYNFDGILIPEIDYVSATRMIALGTGKIFVFEGSQKPELEEELVVEEILSYFHNDKYIGMIYDNPEVENSKHIKVIDMNGKTVMENDTELPYDSVVFLSNNEICLTNQAECEIFTIHGIKKFSYTFDEQIYKIIAGSSAQNYTFIFQETTEEVQLK